MTTLASIAASPRRRHLSGRHDALIQQARAASTFDALKVIGATLESAGRPAGGQQLYEYQRVVRAVLERARELAALPDLVVGEMACWGGGE